MKLIGLVLAGALALSPALAKAADDPFEGWSPAQLKVKVLQLQKENSELKAKLSAAPAAGAAVATAKAATADMLLDDFEGDTAKNGQTWWAGCDDNKLGTTLSPNPWVAEKGGSKLSPGRSGRIKGHFGKTEAPWPWASMSLKMANPDLRGYSAIRFNVKGDGGKYRVQLCKSSVTDYAYHSADFEAPKDWTPVTIKLSDIVQPDWGAKVGNAFEDVEKITFMPITGDKDYDFSIDDLTLVK